MLNLMRKHKKKFFWALWLVIISFVLLYTDLSRRATVQENPIEVAITIGNEKILKNEIIKTFVRLKQSFQIPENDSSANNFLLQQAIESQINYRIQKLEAERLGLIATQGEIQEKISTDFPYFFTKDGKPVDSKAYERILLYNMKMTPAEFEKTLENEILINKLKNLVTAHIDCTENEIKKEYYNEYVKIKADIAYIDAQELSNNITVSDKDLEGYYNKHKDEFKTAEKRKFKYLSLKIDDFIKDVPISEQEIQKYYNENTNLFREPEQVKARHILLKIADKNEEEVKKQAQALYNRIKTGEDFATLAKQYSEDLSSAKNGGDLGFFPKGQMIKEFEDKAFSMQIGEISEPIKTIFGYHIIKVEDKKPAGIKSLFQVQDEIRKKLGSPKAKELANETANKITQWIESNNIDDLVNISQKFNLEVKTTDFLAEQDSYPELSSIAIKKGFELKLKEFSQPIEFFDTINIVQCFDIQEPTIEPLEKVKDKVQNKAKLDKAKSEAQKKLQSLKEVLQTETDFKKAAENLSIKVESSEAFSQNSPIPIIGKNETIAETLFSMKANDVSDILQYEKGAAIFKITEKHDYDEQEYQSKKRELEKKLIEKKQWKFYSAFINNLKNKYSSQIVRNEKVLNGILSL